MHLIELNNVSKSFRAYNDKCHTLKERILFFSRHRYELNHVLKQINLKIDAGKTVGIIGQNGSGKSTLLKVINKIIYPDQGEVIVRGKLSGLLELGVGFYSDFSGRENIYYNASIYGLTRKQIDQRLQRIIIFPNWESLLTTIFGHIHWACICAWAFLSRPMLMPRSC
jgi:ABC-2 type transport system ATP-binding protein